MLVMIGVVFYQSTVSSQEALEWQRHSQDIIYRLDELLYLTLDSEASVRGFAQVGSDTYLDPHRRAESQIKANLSYLRQRFGDHKPQLEELDRLESFLSQYLFEANRKINIRIREGMEAAMLETSPQKVKPIIDGIRTSIDKLKNEESALLNRRERSLSASLKQTIWILISGSVAGIAALFLANWLVSREFRRRRVAEGALVEANQELEQKVTERTQSLESANAELLKVGREREDLLRMEQEARREAEIANRLRDEFMATVSHELRTPLNSILGWARLLQEGDLDEKEVQRAVSTIIRSSENQNRLIEDLLDVARLISGKLDLNYQEVELGEVVRHSVESLRPTADQKGVRLRFDIMPEKPCKLLGDRDRLVQIFSNLIENAIKFSFSGNNVDIVLEECEGKATVRVRDEGAGISPEFLPQVFERFRQESKRDGEVRAGLGLGLAIVRNLTEMHNGTVAVKSEGEGKGSEFLVTLPLSPDDPEIGSDDLPDGFQEISGDNVGLRVQDA